MSDSFYRAFEERYRGSREMIKARQQVYLPFLTPLADEAEPPAALDVGCGRGEWLEVLLENGFAARGIDLDTGMLEACVALGLPAAQGDAIATLQALADDSQAVVSGFHIVEHIPFDSAQLLVNEALRVLKPGGILILETPNPENIVVAGSSFYLDPTHEKPLPHQLLSFLAEFSGFARTKVLRLQEEPHLLAQADIGLMNVLNGTSPDYAIVAQKTAPTEQMAALDDAFAKDYGVALETLAWKYDASVDRRIDQASREVIDVLREVMDPQLQRAEERVCRLERERDEAFAARQAVLDSMSWRITAPMRRLIILSRNIGRSPARSLRTGLSSRVKPVLGQALFGMRSRLVSVARRYPWLAARLRRFRYLEHRVQRHFARNASDSAEMFAERNVSDELLGLQHQRSGHQSDRKGPLEAWFSQQ
ncbi:class I SAM-dependent methyltransferase [Stutzerimonas xanthomarina]|uniref:class I SAM-dependent methyltransferase n=1 Tax=Stutzerimonas xanthomarina TaxID=271420 RepID=UPI003AA84440